MNMTNQYKILALDLDGTLLDAQSRITPENARAVRMAQQAGVQIVLCTGRNVREVRRFSEQLEAAPDWLVTANGAAVQITDAILQEFLYREPVRQMNSRRIENEDTFMAERQRNL